MQIFIIIYNTIIYTSIVRGPTPCYYANVRHEQRSCWNGAIKEIHIIIIKCKYFTHDYFTTSRSPIMASKPTLNILPALIWNLAIQRDSESALALTNISCLIRSYRNVDHEKKRHPCTLSILPKNATYCFLTSATNAIDVQTVCVTEKLTNIGRGFIALILF